MLLQPLAVHEHATLALVVIAQDTSQIVVAQ